MNCWIVLHGSAATRHGERIVERALQWIASYRHTLIACYDTTFALNVAEQKEVFAIGVVLWRHVTLVELDRIGAGISLGTQRCCRSYHREDLLWRVLIGLACGLAFLNARALRGVLLACFRLIGGHFGLIAFRRGLLHDCLRFIHLLRIRANWR